MEILNYIVSLNFLEKGLLVLLFLEAWQNLKLSKSLTAIERKLNKIYILLTSLAEDVKQSGEERIKNEKVLAMMLEWLTDLERKSKIARK